MNDLVLTDDDLKQIRDNEQTVDKIKSDIKKFRDGFPYASLDRPCTKGDGIMTVQESDFAGLEALHAKAADAGRVVKFVPASGAASRMFKDLHSLCNHYEKLKSRLKKDVEDAEVRSFRMFQEKLREFPFFDSLNEQLKEHGKDIEFLIKTEDYRPILEFILSEPGLNYGNLPKGLIEFHPYPPGRTRTAFEEHLVEAAAYACDAKGVARCHFTVGVEHFDRISDHLDTAKKFVKPASCSLSIELSTQKKSTDTIAVDPDNQPFRDHQGRLVFRPGGHGALIENLNELNADIIFIKNIDNIVTDRLKPTTIQYKKLLCGVLLQLQSEIFAHLQRLTEPPVEDQDIDDAIAFLRRRLFVTPPGAIQDSNSALLTQYVVSKLNRPIRVCGMVRNEGEPGGGPFWVEDAKGGESPQVIESSQVDMDSDKQREIWSSATHFNPVDLVCGVKDFRGQSFDLTQYVDQKTGFISAKSYDGRPLKALELPGLWNGAMADWTTVFVDVPIITFNPVKTVYDLLRPEHRPV